MSNAKKPAKKTFDLARYRAEAMGEPFPLRVDDDTVIEIPRPTGDVILAAEQVTSSTELLKLLCGDQYDAFMDVVGKEDFAVLQAISEDMREHFGMTGE